MIVRYTPEKIGGVWTDEMKFQTWLEVELAVIKVRCDQGEYPKEVYPRIKKQAKFNVDKIIELDKIIEHDFLAFIENVRSYLDEDLRKYFHEELTSYDIEIPAQSLQLKRAGVFIIEDLRNFISTVRHQASIHMWTYRMGMTHGKDAKPSTLGWLFCTYLDALELRAEDLVLAFDKVKKAKCSGAVGNYMTISPDLELAVLKELGLEPRPATQITMRDVLANVVSQIAILGGVIEKMAIDLRLMATSRFAEITEPRRKKQKGSSAMPHKKNPILLERMSGMSSVLRGYALTMQENIKTWLERDIAHSSVERIVLPDATSLIDYMLLKMTWIMDNLVVHRDNMAKNIEEEGGTWASEEVKTLLCKKGFDTEKVYHFVQKCAFLAMEKGRSFCAVLLSSEFSDTGQILNDLIDPTEIEACFDFKIVLKKHMPVVYKRNGLNASLAMKANC